MSSDQAKTFISRWSNATTSERANSQLFLSELCDLLAVERPDATNANGYCFEFEVAQHHADGSATSGRIDLYKRGCFVLESKQFQAVKAAQSDLELAAQQAGVLEIKKSSRPVRGTSAWDDAMIKARGQAERYARSLPGSDPAPPFLIVVDVGHTFEVFADFTQAGKAYLHYPDPRTFRIRLEQLADEKIRERLRLIWTNPAALDPAKHSADVTLAISAHMAELAKSLEAEGHTPKAVSDFLTRILFCMFAEDVGLLPERSFTELLQSVPEDGTGFKELLEQLFREMETGTGKGISIVLRRKLLQFSGKLFTDHGALPVNGIQLKLLRLAAKQNWRSVEPAIFGTLLERALDPRERHKRVPLYTYTNPRPAEWPKADFIVGNPPFLGATWLRADFGDGYAETLRATYPDVPESADFVMYWWDKAANLVRAGKCKRFGFITTKTIRQAFNRRILQRHFDPNNPMSLVFAIPNHPWVDTAEGADVRIAMTVGVTGDHPGDLWQVTAEQTLPDGSAKVDFAYARGKIQPDLTIGAEVSTAAELRSNDGLANRGFCLFGAGFLVDAETAGRLGLATRKGIAKHVRPFRNGRDLTDRPRGMMVIDLFGLSAEEARAKFPEVYQHVLTQVKPERDRNNRESRRLNWWIFGEPNKQLRRMIEGLPRYIATTETAKHRLFQFMGHEIAPDNMLVVFALADAFHLGVLSSRIHVLWAIAAGGRLGIGNDPRYNKSRCFDPFPFPACSEDQKSRIRNIAEELDAHRKRVQGQHPELTLTGMYNVMEKLRANEPLTKKDQTIHDLGLVSVLRQLHDDLDAAVFDAYGWPQNLTDAEILERLVALNAERAKEEASGLIRWLRPEYQNPSGTEATQVPLVLRSAPDEGGSARRKASNGKPTWPSSLPERVKAVTAILAKSTGPMTPDDIAAHFKNARRSAITEILETLCTLGQAHKGNQNGSYVL